MIQCVTATIISKKEIATDTIEMKVQLPNEVETSRIKPGQFVHIQIGSGIARPLRRPISIADVNPERNEITLIFKVLGIGTAELRTYQVERALNLLVPCGNGYPIDEINIKQALVIGGGIGVPPLYNLTKRLVQKGINVTVILGFQSKSHVFYEQDFKQLGDCYVVTNDGSYGHQGFVTDVIERIKPSFDYYFSCGPTPMLKAVKDTLKEYDGHISLEERMGCGIGACYACVAHSDSDDKGFKKVCQDGPVFVASEVSL